MPGRVHRVKRDVREFCGYDLLLRLVEASPSLMMKCFVAVLFETGGRVSEVLSLRKRDFADRGDYLEVRLPVLKRYVKVDEVPDPGKPSGRRWVTESIRDEFRTIPILKESPLLPYIEAYLRTLRDDDLLFPFTRQTAFNRLRRIGKQVDGNLELYPHWFRAQKASQLASEYGFSVYDLKEFFRWTNLSTPEMYASLGAKGLAMKMRRAA